MVTPPGAAGYTLMGDRSLVIYQDIIRFTRQHTEKHRQAVFTSRFLNISTVFVTSLDGIQELLSDENKDCFEMGYKKYLHRYFGDALLFENGGEADRLREILKDKFCPSSLGLNQFQQALEKHTEHLIYNVDTCREVSIYKVSKELTVNTGLEFFLNLDVGSDKLAEDMNTLTSTHFKGITSVPVDIKVPFSSYGSAYSKSIDAKKKLMEIINSRLLDSNQDRKPSFLQSVIETPSGGEDYHATSHLLLLLCSIVPKSIASLLSSFVTALAGYDKCEMRHRALNDDVYFEAIYKEVLRLWPPLVGGRREAIKDCTLDGYKVCAGQAVLYITYLAHRDGTAFKNPDQFDPERWLDPKSNNCALFALGGGIRSCIGTHYVSGIVKHVMRCLLLKYDWRLKDEKMDFNYKWIPVLRPKDDVRIVFDKKIFNHIISP